LRYLDASPAEQAVMLALADPIRDLNELVVNRGVGIAFGAKD
jgi:hypothetical protein